MSLGTCCESTVGVKLKYIIFTYLEITYWPIATHTHTNHMRLRIKEYDFKIHLVVKHEVIQLLKDLGIERILKLSLKYNLRVWIGLILHNIVLSGGLL
jgi:E3 ubiquitin-protein ligase DOA10